MIVVYENQSWASGPSPSLLFCYQPIDYIGCVVGEEQTLGVQGIRMGLSNESLCWEYVLFIHIYYIMFFYIFKLFRFLEIQLK